MRKEILWQKAESAGIFLSAAALFAYGDFGWPWWLVLLVFFSADLSCAGYLLGFRAGALIYNLVHNYAPGVLLVAAGVLLQSSLAGALGLLWVAHIGFDRMLGYGLKLETDFTHTHLGPIGKSRVRS